MHTGGAGKSEAGVEHVVPITALSTRVDIVVRSDEAKGQLTAAWSRCLAPSHGHVEDIPQLLAADSTMPLTPELHHRLVARIAEHAFEKIGGQVLLLHAAGICDEFGGVTALVGRSGAGKTTAASRICAHGPGYVTDETVAVTRDGHVVPFPKPLSIDVGREAKEHVGPDQLGLGRAPDDLTLRRILLLDRRSDHVGEPVITPVGDLEAAFELVSHTSALMRVDRPLNRLVELVRSVGGVQLVRYANAEDLIPLVTEASGAMAGIEPVPLQDRVNDGDRMLVLVDDRPHLLGGRASAAYRRVTGELSGAVTPDAEAVAALLSAGLVERTEPDA